MSFSAEDHKEILHPGCLAQSDKLLNILKDESLWLRVHFLYSIVHTLFLRLAIKRTWESYYCGFTTLSFTFGIVQGHVDEMSHC